MLIILIRSYQKDHIVTLFRWKTSEIDFTRNTLFIIKKYLNSGHASNTASSSPSVYIMNIHIYS